jgi:hypothetical protein
MSTAASRKIVFAIAGHELGSAKLYDGILIDTSARWSKDPDLTASIHYRIEAAIRQGCNSICYTNDDGERVAVSWEIEK